MLILFCMEKFVIKIDVWRILIYLCITSFYMKQSHYNLNYNFIKQLNLHADFYQEHFAPKESGLWRKYIPTKY